MADQNEKLAQLQQRLDKMVEYQGYFNREIALLHGELDNLKKLSKPSQPKTQTLPAQQVTPKSDYVKPAEVVVRPQVTHSFQKIEPTPQNSHLEEFVGKNIISIIGIIITIIGVGIGAKYAIDNNLISPATRIIIGYIFAFGLLGFAFKLKENYDKFSAVLLSGAVAIMYFLTFFAYSFYDLISQTFAFAVMVLITIFTVFSALKYDRQVIAVIGLVGAYSVPFLLGDGSGRVVILFGYISIINIGMLAVSIKKYWKILHISAFALTWLIFWAWFADKYRFDEHFTLAFVFATIFFVIFYASFIAHNLLYKENLLPENIALLLVNAFIYFGLGYSILDSNNQSREFFGFFTLAVAAVHLIAGYLISIRLVSRQTLYFTLGLALFLSQSQFPSKWKEFGFRFFGQLKPCFYFGSALQNGLIFMKLPHISSWV